MAEVEFGGKIKRGLSGKGKPY